MVHDDPEVDPLVELARTRELKLGWIAPRELFLERGGAPSFPPATTLPQSVQILERHGGEVRIGLRLGKARIALWADAASLSGVVLRDAHLDDRGGTASFDAAQGSTADVVLHPGAHVTVLARDGGRVHVRYTGLLEADGWIAADAIADRWLAHPSTWHGSFFQHRIAVFPGAAVRTEPAWAARVLAVAVRGDGLLPYSLRDLGDERYEVAHDDAELSVHGFISLRDPPEMIRGETGQAMPPPPPATPTTATVAAGTCLYAREHGEAVGFVTTTAALALEPTSGSWFAITLDTAWGPLTFAAQGTTATALVGCDPARPPPP